MTGEIKALRMGFLKTGSTHVLFAREGDDPFIDPNDTIKIKLPLKVEQDPHFLTLPPDQIERLRKFIAEPPAPNSGPFATAYGAIAAMTKPVLIVSQGKDGGLMIGIRDHEGAPSNLFFKNSVAVMPIECRRDPAVMRIAPADAERLADVLRPKTLPTPNAAADVTVLAGMGARNWALHDENERLRLKIADLHDRLRLRSAVDFEALEGTMEGALEIVNERIDIELNDVGIDPTKYPDACAKVAEMAMIAKYLREGIAVAAAEVEKEEDEAAADEAVEAAIRFDLASIAADARGAERDAAGRQNEPQSAS